MTLKNFTRNLLLIGFLATSLTHSRAEAASDQCSEHTGQISCFYKYWSWTPFCRPEYRNETCYVWIASAKWTELEREMEQRSCPKGCNVPLPKCQKTLSDYNEVDIGLKELVRTMYSDKASCMAAAARYCAFVNDVPGHWVFDKPINYSCGTGEIFDW